MNQPPPTSAPRVITYLSLVAAVGLNLAVVVAVFLRLLGHGGGFDRLSIILISVVSLAIFVAWSAAKWCGNGVVREKELVILAIIIAPIWVVWSTNVSVSTYDLHRLEWWSVPTIWLLLRWRYGRPWRVTEVVALASSIVLVLAPPVGLLRKAVLRDRLPSRISIMKAEIQPIAWPGFEYPIGLRVKVVLLHPSITHLELGMVRIEAESRMQNVLREVQRVVKPSLPSNPRSLLYEPAAPSIVGAPSTPAAPGTTTVVFSLYPRGFHGVVENPSRFCLDLFRYEVDTAAVLGATWVMYNSGQSTESDRIDVGPMLVAALQAEPLFSAKQYVLMNSQLRLPQLQQHGFADCSGGAGVRCYCRS